MLLSERFGWLLTAQDMKFLKSLRITIDGDKRVEPKQKCNYCQLLDINRVAKSLNRSVVVKKPKLKLGGVDVYVVDDGQQPNSDNWVKYFWKMHDHCVC